MAILDISGPEAQRRLESSRVARWSSGWEVEPEAGTAWNRLQEAVFTPEIDLPQFKIEPTDSIFAIGSCFARGVEGTLGSLGFRVTSRTDEFNGFDVRATGYPHDYTNKYNPFAILNELQWALDPGCAFPEEAVLEVTSDQCLDPHAQPVFGLVRGETALERHRMLTRLVGRVRECRVVIITLGLIEAWFDTDLELYTNSAPWRSGPTFERFRFHVLDYAQVLFALEEVHRTLSTWGHEDVQIVVTVSPVPLDATFTGSDIVVANTHSKSLLRTAAAEWAARHENVHYFPSYEIVMSSDRPAAWHMDGRHVRLEVVSRIMDTFTSAFVAEVGLSEPVSVHEERVGG